MAEKYDIVVVGAGIAGMTAAIYAKRAGKSVLVLEKKVAGGQIVTADCVKNYPGFSEISGAELMKKIAKQVKELGVEIRYEEVVEIIAEEVKHAGKILTVTKEMPFKIVKTEEGEYEAGAVILALGTEEEKLGLDREDELAGVSYCATCDGALFAGKAVAVVGGGNTALHEALYLSDIAEKVYLVHRREEFRGEAVLVEALSEKENVEFVLGARVTELLGEEKLTGVKLNDGRVLEVEGLFVAIGQRPKTEEFSELVEVDEKWYIVAGEDCYTSVEGIYAAGDCRTKSLHQLVTAAADGAVAATEAVKNLK